jgi:hypothetical protein
MKQQTHMINKGLVILLLAALPLSAMAVANYIGPAGGDIADPLNWDSSPFGGLTESRIDAPDAPVMSSGTITLGTTRIKNAGASITITGGSIDWDNATSQRGLGMFTAGGTPALLHMTGGAITNDTIGLGCDLFSDTLKGTATLDIWDTAVVELQPAAYLGMQTRPWNIFDITVNPGSVIDIRGDGQLRIPDNTFVWDQDGLSYSALADALKLKLEGYALDGRLVVGDGGEIAWTHDLAAAQWVITAIPEPGTLALLGVGLCSLLLIRSRRA